MHRIIIINKIEIVDCYPLISRCMALSPEQKNQKKPTGVMVGRSGAHACSIQTGS